MGVANLCPDVNLIGFQSFSISRHFRTFHFSWRKKKGKLAAEGLGLNNTPSADRRCRRQDTKNIFCLKSFQGQRVHVDAAKNVTSRPVGNKLRARRAPCSRLYLSQGHKTRALVADRNASVCDDWFRFSLPCEWWNCQPDFCCCCSPVIHIRRENAFKPQNSTAKKKIGALRLTKIPHLCDEQQTVNASQYGTLVTCKKTNKSLVVEWKWTEEGWHVEN